MWESSARNICIYLRQACFSELLIFWGNEWVPCKTSKLQRDKIVIAHMITAFMNNFLLVDCLDDTGLIPYELNSLKTEKIK